MPHGISCKKNIIKECEEEAGIPASISTNVIPVGAVSYMDIEGYRYKRDVLFCYDLKLPPDFVPKNEDGEVDSFRLITVSQAANIIRRTEFYKPNCCLVILDFLFRHGYSLAIDGLVEKPIELSLAQIRLKGQGPTTLPQPHGGASGMPMAIPQGLGADFTESNGGRNFQALLNVQSENQAATCLGADADWFGEER
ncbi:Nudix hydrolase 20 [Carex littledalei]|uniref:Nudix hydrolase 20 n=1 Tax=Carex littledalei TaxID=544730 RepID=A0A833REJ4_9POAL|nr:Nudix hydrolase 20 [Carex littledalei]